MNSPKRRSLREEFRRAMRATEECLTFERLGEEHSAGEREHLLACAHCQAELALWREFEASSADVQDAAAVQWIVEELRRGRSSPGREPGGGVRSAWLSTRGLMAAAASLALAVTVGYVVWDREPAIGDIEDGAQQAYRTAQLPVVAPVGDVVAGPREFRWALVQGAVSYDLAIFEVDGTVVWRTFSSEGRIAPPESVRSKFVSGKPFVWEVTARDASNAVIARSGIQRFRVLNSSSTGG